MPIEFERRFLVKTNDYRNLTEPAHCTQGYLVSMPERTVRVRLIDNRGFITIKGRTEAFKRTEFEYEIPATDAKWMLENLCEKPLIKKKRYTIEIDGFVWHIDEFEEENSGLIIAEVHLESQQQQPRLPEWLGEEISGDERYYNANLARYPYTRWQKPRKDIS